MLKKQYFTCKGKCSFKNTCSPSSPNGDITSLFCFVRCKNVPPMPTRFGVAVAQLALSATKFCNVMIICHFWIASCLAMTVSAYRHCEEERRNNPVKNNFLNRPTILVITHSINSKDSCATTSWKRGGAGEFPPQVVRPHYLILK